jgi:hypothetical protein
MECIWNVMLFIGISLNRIEYVVIHIYKIKKPIFKKKKKQMKTEESDWGSIKYKKSVIRRLILSDTIEVSEWISEHQSQWDW